MDPFLHTPQTGSPIPSLPRPTSPVRLRQLELVDSQLNHTGNVGPHPAEIKVVQHPVPPLPPT